MPGALYVLIQEVFKARRTLESILAQIEFHAVAHQDSVSSFLKKLHKCPGDWQSNQSEDYRQENWRLNLVLIGLDARYEQISDYRTDCNDQGSPYVDEQLGCTVTNKKLGTASQHQVKGLLSRSTEVFARNRHHNISILC